MISLLTSYHVTKLWKSFLHQTCSRKTYRLESNSQHVINALNEIVKEARLFLVLSVGRLIFLGPYVTAWAALCSSRRRNPISVSINLNSWAAFQVLISTLENSIAQLLAIAQDVESVISLTEEKKAKKCHTKKQYTKKVLRIFFFLKRVELKIKKAE